jgi:hypothetical protein
MSNPVPPVYVEGEASQALAAAMREIELGNDQAVLLAEAFTRQLRDGHAGTASARAEREAAADARASRYRAATAPGPDFTGCVDEAEARARFAEWQRRTK